MAPPGRKSGGKSLIVTLNASPSDLKSILERSFTPKEETPAKEEPSSSPAESAAAGATQPTPNENTDSNAPTPAKEGTPMGPPTDAPKKKGTKRGAPKEIDGVPKPRGKPGPKKKPRLEDGTIDPNAQKGAIHKLGPKANQGAINAGLRALDRSGKPCRKWNKGGFTLKSFTGVVWEVNRWTAPPKPKVEGESTEASAAQSVDNASSGKENAVSKDVVMGEAGANGTNGNANEANGGSQENGGVTGEQSAAPSIHASSPAPMPVGAAA